MKKIIIFKTLVLVFMLGCSNKSPIPPKYSPDNGYFKGSIALLNDARDLSFSRMNRKIGLEATKDIDVIVIFNTQKGIDLGRRVRDEYFGYIHPELKDMFKNKLIKGSEIFCNGIKANNSGHTKEGLKKQMEGNKLIIEWINWWEINNKDITEKIITN